MHAEWQGKMIMGKDVPKDEDSRFRIELDCDS